MALQPNYDFGEAQAPGGRDLEREREGERKGRAVSSPCVSAVHSGLSPLSHSVLSLDAAGVCVNRSFSHFDHLTDRIWILMHIGCAQSPFRLWGCCSDSRASSPLYRAQPASSAVALGREWKSGEQQKRPNYATDLQSVTVSTLSRPGSGCEQRLPASL